MNGLRKRQQRISDGHQSISSSDDADCNKQLMSPLQSKHDNDDRVVVSIPPGGHGNRQIFHNSKYWKIVTFCNFLVHAIAFFLYLWGIFFVRPSFHTGIECEMTYSMREFLPIETSLGGEIYGPWYKLYKFVDKRDPRYRPLWNETILKLEDSQRPLLSRTKHCSLASNIKNIVLYIPGHWGSYSQARSLGAHGIQLTRARDPNVHQMIRKLSSTKPTSYNNATTAIINKSDFIYDVYAIDFAEQGGAIHGKFLQYQSEYVASVIEQLVTDCKLETEESGTSRPSSTLTIVAHSMGGYVARLALLHYPHLNKYIRNIITLATPHSNPLYGFDPSIRQLHQQLLPIEKQHSNENFPMIISISGGLRDEMIDPASCQSAPYANNDSVSVLSTHLLNNNNNDDNVNEHTLRALLGMDHRAIVWCHQLLDQVRNILYALTTSNHLSVNDRRNRLLSTLDIDNNNVESYSQDVEDLYKTMKIKYGYWKAIIIEATMLYNLPYLYSLYTILSGLYCAIADSDPVFRFIPLIATILLGWLYRSVHVSATIILALVADTVHGILFYILPVGFLRKNNANANPFGPLRKTLMWTSAIISIASVCICKFVHLELNREFVYCLLYICTIVSMYLILMVWMECSTRHESTFDIQVVTLAIMTVPAAVVGPLTLMYWEGTARTDSWWTLLSIQIPIGLLAILRIKKYRKQAAMMSPLSIDVTFRARIRSILIATIVVGMSPWTISRGTGYLIPYAVKTIAWIDLAILLFSSTTNMHS